MENVIQIPLSLGETLRLEFDESDGSVGCGLTCEERPFWLTAEDMEKMISALQRMQARQRGQG